MLTETWAPAAWALVKHELVKALKLRVTPGGPAGGTRRAWSPPARRARRGAGVRHTFDMLKLLGRPDRGGPGGHAAAVE